MEPERLYSKIKVLMYHRVAKDDFSDPGNIFYISERLFKKHLWLLSRLNYTTITFEDYDLHRRGRLTLPARPIILTFDDGHRDTFDVARPHILDFDMKAVVFIVGSFKHKHACWDQTEKPWDYPLLERQQIRALRQDGFEIGAHSVNHPYLTRLPEDGVRFEVNESKKFVERILEEQVISFAYPYGDINEIVKKVVIDSGFRYACGVYSGQPGFEKDLFDIRRISITKGTSSLGFLRKLLLPLEDLNYYWKNFKTASGEKPQVVSTRSENTMDGNITLNCDGKEKQHYGQERPINKFVRP